jgi:polyhydroxybutyrate depolymerase
MKRIHKLIVLLMVITLWAIQPVLSRGKIQIQRWKVGDTDREALLYVPAFATGKPSPVIFLFHGHGGDMRKMFDNHRFDKLWPEAIVVVPQGLNTPGKLIDHTGKRTGWQQAPGDMNDRDLHFFDDILQTLHKQYQIDNKRIYATGHSNGGNFTYLLSAMRGSVLVAIAPSAAALANFDKIADPKPVMHIVLKLNQCSIIGRPYAPNAIVYTSPTHNPVVVYTHTGGHIYPPEADSVVIKFFKSITGK